MSMCQCLIASGPEKGHRCRHPAKYPVNAPRFCGHHKKCKTSALATKNLGSNKKYEVGSIDEKILKEIITEKEQF